MASLLVRPAPAGIGRYLPVLQWLPGYDRAWLRGDLVAGITTAAVVIPQAMAYASIAGLPIQHGLYTAIAAMLAYALLGTSRCLSVSVTSTVSILVASTIAEAEDPVQRAALLGLVVGAILVLAGLFQLGFVARFISLPVLAGFKAGAGVLIAASQLGKVLGFEVEGSLAFDRLRSALSQIDQTNEWVLGFALLSIALLVLLKLLVPRVPGPLIVVVLGVLAVRLTDLPDRGLTTVGDIPAGLPSLELPGSGDLAPLIAPAMGISLMAYVESIAAARAFARKDEPKVDVNQELIALGGASIVSGLFQGYPAGGGLSQTAVNRETGARSQIASLVTVAVIGLTLTVLMAFVGDIPNATLGAIVLVAAAGLIDIETFRQFDRITRRAYLLALITFAAVVLEGVLVGVVASLAALLREIGATPVDTLGRDPQSGRWGSTLNPRYSEGDEGVIVVRPYGRLSFVNVDSIIDRMIDRLVEADGGTRAIVIDLSAVPEVEITALEELADWLEDVRALGLPVAFARITPALQETTERGSRVRGAPSVPIFPTVGEAVSFVTSTVAPEEAGR